MSELVVETANLSIEETQSTIPEHHKPVEDSTIQYGAAATNLEGHRPETFYITTAIAYTNGYPHMGHAYEFLSTDVLARYHRILGFDTFFLTGADEHGQKVAASAEKAGLSPKKHCDIYVDAFKALCQRLLVKFDGYVRTTDEKHKLCAQELWKRCAAVGDIYLDKYEGWYNEREETFVSETEALEMNYIDTGSGLPLKKCSEESYFFKMSNYTDRLMAHFTSNPDFVQPEGFRKQIMTRIEKEGLRDLSLSRTSFRWGVAMPEGFDDRHVMYVWFDALSNYISGVDIFDESSPLQRYWPAQCHVIGKDIIWFHCVIWPCMIMSAGLPLPANVYSHGFVNAADGTKMSKSLNNAVDPHDILSRFSPDTIRYYFCNHVYGGDINFSEPGMVLMHNSELADVLGNLVQRAMVLIGKYCDHVIPDCEHDAVFNKPFAVESLVEGIRKDMLTKSIDAALGRSMEAVRATNRFLTEAEPWKMKGTDEARRGPVVRTTLEAIYIFTHFLTPIIPQAAEKIFAALGTPPRPAFALNPDFYNLSAGTVITPCPILFKREEQEKKAKTLVVDNGVKAKRQAAMALEKSLDPNQPDFTKIELRVGRITKVWAHESAERLYCEEVDIGEDKPRPIASGVREFYTLEQMHGRAVVVVCNLKEASMKGFTSTGMVLAAKSSDGSKLELVDPPADAEVGERLVVDGLVGPPWPATKIKKLKLWESISADLRTGSDCIVQWQGKSLITEKGGKTCSVPSNADMPVS